MFTTKMDNEKSQPDEFIVENNIWKGKVTSFKSDYKNMGELLWKKIEMYKNQIAHLDAQTGKTVTYGELQNKVVRCALWLRGKGIKSGDIITVCTSNHLDSIVPCLAAVYINAIHNAWNEDMNLHTAHHMVELIMPNVVFCTKTSVGVVSQALADKRCDCIVVVFGSHPGAIAFSDVLSGHSDSQIANFRYTDLDDPDQTFCILHSSGTTGMPKGVEISAYRMQWIIETSNINVADIALWFSSLYWISGIMMNLKAIVSGIKVIIYPHFDEEMTCRLIGKHKIQWLFLSTSMTNRLLRSGYATKYPLSSLKIILCGGAILKLKAQEDLKRILPHVEILQAYGMTELSGVITLQHSSHKIGSCGSVLSNVQLKIVDPDSGVVLGPNQSGEVYAKTPTMMKGYYKNPKATRQTIDEQGWLHSGDIGYMDDDGELYIKDRVKDLIKYRGLQISPAEIEVLLHAHPAVMEVAVMGVPHSTDDEHPIAFVTVKPGMKVTEKELVDLVANELSDQFKLRAGVVFLETFPYTGTGKISKKDLRVMATDLAIE